MKRGAARTFGQDLMRGEHVVGGGKPRARRAAQEATPEGQVQEPVRRGRKPKLELDDKLLNQIYGLGQLKCSMKEAASFLSVGHSTLKDFFKKHPEAREAFEDGQNAGNISLRRNQLLLSKKNAAMAIWLGKQWLGQRDVTEHEHSGKGGGPIETRDVSARSVLASRIAGIASRIGASGSPAGAN